MNMSIDRFVNEFVIETSLKKPFNKHSTQKRNGLKDKRKIKKGY